MAIINNVSLTPLTTTSVGDRSGTERSFDSSLYKIDMNFRKDFNETDHIKWCRRNLGERGNSWDFWIAGGILFIEVKGEKARFTYEMWKN